MPKKFPTPNYKGESSDDSVCVLDDGQEEDRKNAAKAYKKAVERAANQKAKRQAAAQTVSLPQKLSPETRDFRLRKNKNTLGANMDNTIQLTEVSGNRSPLLGDNDAANPVTRWWNGEGMALCRRRTRNYCAEKWALVRDWFCSCDNWVKIIMMAIAFGTFIVACLHLTKAQEAAEMQAKILAHLKQPNEK